MNVYDIKRYDLILAVQAEIEGLKAENIYQERRGETNPYTELSGGADPVRWSD